MCDPHVRRITHNDSHCNIVDVGKEKDERGGLD